MSHSASENDWAKIARLYAWVDFRTSILLNGLLERSPRLQRLLTPMHDTDYVNHLSLAVREYIHRPDRILGRENPGTWTFPELLGDAVATLSGRLLSLFTEAHVAADSDPVAFVELIGKETINALQMKLLTRYDLAGYTPLPLPDSWFEKVPRL